MPTATFNFRQLRAELMALVGIAAQTAWTAACKLVVLPAENGEAREASPSSYVSQRRPAMRRAMEVPLPSARDSTVAPLEGLDVGRFRQELDALRRHMNHLAVHRELDRGSVQQPEVDDGGIDASLYLQQRHAANQSAFGGDALTNAVRLLEKGPVTREHARSTSLSLAANAG